MLYIKSNKVTLLAWVVGWLHLWYALMWLRDAVKARCYRRYALMWLRDAVVVYTHISPLLATRVSSSSVVRASVLDLGGSWVQIPSGARIFSEFP